MFIVFGSPLFVITMLILYLFMSNNENRKIIIGVITYLFLLFFVLSVILITIWLYNDYKEQKEQIELSKPIVNYESTNGHSINGNFHSSDWSYIGDKLVLMKRLEFITDTQQYNIMHLDLYTSDIDLYSRLTDEEFSKLPPPNILLKVINEQINKWKKKGISNIDIKIEDNKLLLLIWKGYSKHPIKYYFK